ncbi:hypothetical protein DW322_16590 [Rhodococcus rhodnii]|uniref:Uncharacterized protein n=1 Tax=Rhodococcus rhodnii TaxID=38312 RepID=A0A6P2CGM2_9NOCA|nr:hypothetical protein DW322_16590 [Rhodococcus rhodnii]
MRWRSDVTRHDGGGPGGTCRTAARRYSAAGGSTTVDVGDRGHADSDQRQLMADLRDGCLGHAKESSRAGATTHNRAEGRSPPNAVDHDRARLRARTSRTRRRRRGGGGRSAPG